MMKLKIQKMGDSLGASLPQTILDRLQVGEGDELYVSETPEGVKLTAHNPEFEQVMEAASTVTQRYENALRELAQ